MKNIELHTVKIGRKVREVKVTDSKLRLDFGDKNVLDINSHHSQDCCESVYADFSTAEYYIKNILDFGTVTEITIKAVPDMGFLLCLQQSSYYSPDLKIFIPCYEFQNGYYSSDLSLEVKYKGSKKTLDISNLVESHIE